MKAVSYADVQVALAGLIERKEPITLSNLRVALGNRGSMSTLSKHLQRWKHEQALDTLPPGPVNPAPEPIMAAVQGVWQQLFDQGQQELTEQKQLFEAQRQEFEQNLQLAQQQAQQANEEAAQLRIKILEAQKRADLSEKNAQDSARRTELAEQQSQHAQQAQQQSENLWKEALANLDQWQHQWQEQWEKEQQSYQSSVHQMKEDHAREIEQEKKRHQEDFQELQKSYQELQKHCASVEAQLAQQSQLSEILEKISAQIQQHHQSWQEADFIKKFQEIQQQIAKISYGYESVSFSKIKGYS